MDNNWDKLKEQIYFEDGSFRDIYAFDMNVDMWKKWSDFVNQNYEMEFIDRETNQNQSSINFSTIENLWSGKSDYSKLATIKLDGININCHFFTADEFENDITPTEFESIEKHQKFIEYLKNLSNLFDRKIYLTCENSPNLILIEVFKSEIKINYEK